MFGPYQPVHLVLMDLPFTEDALKGLEMELEDGAFPLIHGITKALSPEDGF